MNKLVKNGVLLAVGGLSLTSCGKQDLIDENLKLQNQVDFYRNQAKLVWEKLNAAQDTIDANLITIDGLELQVEDLASQVLVLETENARLEQVVADLLIEIARLEQIIMDFENEVIRINNLLVIEQQKVNANNVVIETLENELAVKQAKYDSLVANPIIITEVRYQIVETIIETQQEFSDDQYNALYLGVSEIRGLLNGVIANLRGDIVIAQEKLAIAKTNEDNANDDYYALLSSVGSHAQESIDAQKIATLAKAKTEEIENTIESLGLALQRMTTSMERINGLLTN